MAFELWWGRRRLKSGKLAKHADLLGCYRYTKLDRCEHCARLGPTSWVRRWWYQSHDLRMAERHEPVLCIGCFNRMRPHWRKDREARELAALARKLGREITRAKENANIG
jgi:hypothetical protein